MRDRDKIGLPPEEQEVYVLLKTKPYDGYYRWKEGDKLRRISKWLSGNGCGVRQAYFEPIDRPGHDGTVWEDHVKLAYETRDDLLDNADRLQAIINERNLPIRLIAVNKMNRNSCVCQDGQWSFNYLIWDDGHRRDGEFRGYKDAPNFISIDDLMEEG